jgi:type I restriction enzyme S subunit
MSWKKRKISDFTNVITGGTPSTLIDDYWIDGKIPWLNSGELSQDIITYSTNFITEKGLLNSSARLMPKHSVLIALTGTTTGKTAYMTIEACANQSVTGILPSSNHEPKFLYYYLSSIRPKILNDSYGGAQKHISQQYVKEIQIPLPSLHIQKQIANILDKADALRKNDQQLLQKYDELAQSIFIDMFGDPVKNEKGWEVKKLGELGEWKSGGTPSRSNKTYFEGSIPWVSSGELNDIFISNSKELITKSAVENSSTSLILKGSLMLGMYDTAALKSSINTIPICCNQAIAFSRLRDDSCNTLFIYYVIQISKEDLKRQQRGVRQKNMNLSMIKEIELIQPPKAKQDKFAILFKIILEQKSLISKNMEEHLFQSLLQKAFTGELIDD